MQDYLSKRKTFDKKVDSKLWMFPKKISLFFNNFPVKYSEIFSNNIVKYANILYESCFEAKLMEADIMKAAKRRECLVNAYTYSVLLNIEMELALKVLSDDNIKIYNEKILSFQKELKKLSDELKEKISLLPIVKSCEVE